MQNVIKQSDFILMFNPSRHAVSDYSRCKPEIKVHIFGALQNLPMICLCGLFTLDEIAK